jgi:phosphohistidine swiveling domain-containing protein
MTKNASQNLIFTSKTDVLKFLQRKIKKSKIEKLYNFTVENWNQDSNEIMKEIQKKFKATIIVRSSAIGEDSEESSHAGSYESVLNIDPKSKNQIKKAINKVIKSYKDKENYFLGNEILIQNQTNKVILSGVIFSRIPESGSPYYLINFERSSRTDGVTKGLSNNTIKLFRHIKKSNIPKEWKNLILSIKEIEKKCSSDSLDIEFAIKENHEIIVFQVRPLTTTKKISKEIDKKIQTNLKNEKEKFKKISIKNRSRHNFTMFTDMSDWNPSEIIGDNPNNLDYSLYDLLIMKNAWYKGREMLGYHKPNNYCLMTKFGNKPYVDLRRSFESLIPKNIPIKIKNKLLNFYFQKLLDNPHLQDKIEFDILFTCFDATTKERILELKNYGFNISEINVIKNELLNFTNIIINEFPKLKMDCDNSLKKLKQDREKILKDTSLENNTKKIIYSIEKLLNNCVNYGTINFSMMARIAFISSSIFKSLERENIIAFNDVKNFMNSIVTPLSEFQNDIYLYSKKKISKRVFLQKYGHLRPGTYDITAKRYDSNNEIISKMNFKINKKKTQKLNSKKISFFLKEQGLDFSIVKLDYFLRKSLEQREKLKFEFTKNLSESLELIAKLGKILEIQTEDLAYLEIDNILNCKKLSEYHTRNKIKRIIQKNKKIKDINNLLILPPIISSKGDFENIKYYASKPNYISINKTIGNLLLLDKKNIKSKSIKNKIILIENADPGYDWIFTQNPLALITKYGGVASHMAIRCAEVGLPAAIGCGEILYEKLIHSSKVMLDCKNKQILILEHHKKDDFLEERKVLKSLGYIK